jgi:PQQ-dependent catabolism-associated CXXCW motif protein
VWRDPAHESIEGAVWLANVGYGKLAPEVADYFRAHLAALTDGGKSRRPIVFFCLRNCWMSWNAAKRALEWGFANVVWYPDGSDGWRDIGLPITPLKPLP